MGMWRGPRRDVSIPAAGGFGSRIPPVSQMWGWDYLSPPPSPVPIPVPEGSPFLQGPSLGAQGVVARAWSLSGEGWPGAHPQFSAAGG